MMRRSLVVVLLAATLYAISPVAHGAVYPIVLLIGIEDLMVWIGCVGGLGLV